MALGYLLILFIVMMVVSIVGISLLYLLKNKKAKNIIFYCLAAWSMCIAFLNATSLPINFLTEQLVAWSFGFLSVIAIIFNIKKPEKSNIAYIIVVVSILLGLYTLFFS